MRPIFHLAFLLLGLAIQCSHDASVGYVIVTAIVKVIVHAIVIAIVPIAIAIDVQSPNQKSFDFLQKDVQIT